MSSLPYFQPVKKFKDNKNLQMFNFGNTQYNSFNQKNMPSNNNFG